MERLGTMHIRFVRTLLRAYPFVKGRWRIARLLLDPSAPPERPIPYERVARAIPDGRVVRTRYGGSVRLHRDPMYVMPYLFGDYEPASSALFRALVRPGDTAFDVGSNFGWYT